MPEKSTVSEKVVAWTALVVAIASAAFTYVQTSTTKAELRLQELQIRPYVKYIPSFSESGGEIDVEMHSENLSSIPALIIYTDLTGWVDGVTSGANMHSTHEDFLYQHKGGRSDLPPIVGAMAKRISTGDSVLQIGSCVIYAPLSTSDSRRWLVESLYQYKPGAPFPTEEYMNEKEVPASVTSCRSGDIRKRWLKSRPTASTE